MNPTFSQRIGKTPIKDKLQVESLDEETRWRLWNVIIHAHPMMQDSLTPDIGEFRRRRYDFFHNIWHNLLREDVSGISSNLNEAAEFLHRKCETWEWYEVFDFVEFFGDDARYRFADRVREVCNTVFTEEVVGYRFVGKQITPITSAVEVEQIEQALKETATEPLGSVRQHLEAALAKFADRKAPDYRNSIKEAISAVEALSSLIVGKPTTLGDALKRVKEKVGLHPALQKAFSAIYGWTSDEGGIRHALTDESLRCEAEDAQYMLVSCSAFVSYLLVKADRAGVKLT
jgi:hypothetical protein